ncbi:MAG: ATP-binding protein [Rhodospirillaceae bacterium]|nr:ATP-binding protein [Rhodospirillaceae bacterium]
MISSLRIHNFKSIADAQLDFGRVNLLIGANGSGKSNLLEAIGLYSACLGRIDPDSLSSKGVRLSAVRIFTSSFKNRRTSTSIRLDGSINGIQYAASLRTKPDSSQLEFHSETLSAKRTTIFRRTPTTARMHRSNSSSLEVPLIEGNSHRGLWDTHGSSAHLTPDTRVQLDAVAKYVIYAPQTAVMRGLVPDNRATEPLGLTGGRLPQALRELLAQMVGTNRKEITRVLKIIWTPGWAETVEVGPPNLDVVPDVLPTAREVIYIVDKYMKKNRNTLSLYDASEGTLFLLFVATMLAHAKSPPIFALDNVDGTLNPAMVKSLVAHIVTIICGDRNKGYALAPQRQVFLTSHNPSALDAVDLFESDQRLFVVSRNASGHTVFDRIQPPQGMTKEDWIVTRRGKTLSQLWLDGRIRNALGWES